MRRWWRENGRGAVLGTLAIAFALGAFAAIIHQKPVVAVICVVWSFIFVAQGDPEALDDP